jgi:hypothetical protein
MNPENPLDLSSSDPRVVFVGGLHRSGTTPLTRALALHPQVSGFADTGAEEDEGQHLQDVMPAARAYGGPGRFALDPRCALTEASPLATPDNARRLAMQWSRYWDLSRPILVEKSPPNIVRMRFLQTLFPSASFVMIIRHPVVVSLSTKKWAPRRTYRSVFENWFAAHDTMRRDASFVDRLLVVKYEELISNTTVVLSSVASFLDLDGPIPEEVVQRGRSSTYEQTWARWKTSTNPLIRHRYEHLVDVFGDRATEYGYRLDDLNDVRPITFGREERR